MQEHSDIIYRHKNTYDLSEHMRFEAYSFALGKKWKTTAKRAGFFFAMAALIFIVLVIKQEIKPAELILPGIMVLIGILVIAMNGPMGRRLAWNMTPNIHDMEQEYLFYQDHFDYITPMGQLSVEYKDIYYIGETANNIYIMLSAQQGMSLIKRKCPGGLPYFLKLKFEESHGAK